ncbi:hypothetical protein Drorol1_Dr00022995 [Drosera rotundifolia]
MGNCLIWRMNSPKEQPGKSPVKLVTLDNAYKLAEQWVKNMAGDLLDEDTEINLETRAPGLGLGAAVPRKTKPELTNDPAARKLHSMFKADARKRQAAADEVSTRVDDEDNDDDAESRTKAFDKKRVSATNPTVVGQTGKKKRKK